MSIKTSLNPKRWTVKVRVIVAAALALVLAGGGLAAAYVLRPAEPVAAPATPTATPAPTTTPTPTPTPRVAEVPRTAVARGTVAGWTLADRTQLAAVLPQVGDAADGDIAVSIDAPVVPEPRAALTTTVEVQPSTEYLFTGSFRLPEEFETEAPATLHVGADTMTLPDLNADWLEVEFSYETGPEETSVDLSIVVDDVVRGLDVDDLSFAATGGDNVLPNPSFEDVAADWGIRNDSLILQEQTAALAVQMAPGEATWVATGLAGEEVATGVAALTDRLSAIPLDNLGQGYYNVTVTDAAGQQVTAPLGLIDMPTAHVPTDTRIGAHIHAQKDFNAEATLAAGAIGMGILRVGDNWQVTEPTPGQYAFSPNFTRAFGEADAIGMEKLMIVGRTNTAYDGNLPPHTADGLAAYSRYAAALAQNFDLDAIEIYNEFNIRSFNKGFCNGDASCYAPILKAGFDGVKSVKPDLTVIGGVTGNFDGAWFDVLWRNGGLANLDAVSFHPYQVYTAPERLAGIMRDSRAGMDAHGGSKPVWITELGWTTKTGDVSYEEQANMVIRAEIAALASGVERYLWYNLINDENNRAAHEGNFGQFWQPWSGVAAFPPKPAAFTQALLLTTLAGKEFDGGDKLGVDGMQSLRFTDGDETVRYAWMQAGEGTAEYEADGPLTVTAANGHVEVIQPVNGKVSVPLSTTPRIITGGSDAR